MIREIESALYWSAEKVFGFDYLMLGVLATGMLLGWSLAAIVYHLL